MSKTATAKKTEKQEGGAKITTVKSEFTLTFTEDILGSWPSREDILTRFISSKAPAEWLADEERESLPEDAVANRTVFPRDENGLHLFNFHVKGLLKEAGNTLKQQLKIKNLRSKIDNYVFIHPRKIYITRDGKPVTEPDDVFERPLRAQTMQGPRVALTASERVKAPAEITFTVELVENDEIAMDTIHTLLDFGRLKGMGQWRNGGYGSFTWKEKEKEKEKENNS